MPAPSCGWDVLQKECSYRGKAKAASAAVCRNSSNISGRCRKVQCPLKRNPGTRMTGQHQQRQQTAEHAAAARGIDGQRQPAMGVGRMGIELAGYGMRQAHAGTCARAAQVTGVGKQRALVVERSECSSVGRHEVRLSVDTQTALAQVAENLQSWSHAAVVPCKQDVLRQEGAKAHAQQLALHPGPKLACINRQQERRMGGKEGKAERAAKLEVNIEKELLARLHGGHYEVPAPLDLLSDLVDHPLDEEASVPVHRHGRSRIHRCRQKDSLVTEPVLEEGQDLSAAAPETRDAAEDAWQERPPKRRRKTPAPRSRPPVRELEVEKELLGSLLDW